MPSPPAFFSISETDFRPTSRNSGFREEESKRRKDQGAGGKPSNDLLELADINFGNPLAQPPPAPTRTAASTGDPWGMVEPANNDPWGGSVPAVSSGGDAHDPWSPVQHAALTEQPRASPLAHGGLRSPGTNGDLYPALRKKKLKHSLCNIAAMSFSLIILFTILRQLTVLICKIKVNVTLYQNFINFKVA